MKNLIIIIMVIGLMGGGFYFYKNKSSKISEQNTTQNHEDDSHDEMEGAENVTPQNVTPISTSNNTPVSQSTNSGTTKTFVVNGNNFTFDVKTMEVNKGDKVVIIFKNTGGKHDWKIDEFTGAATKIINGGEEDTIEFIADKVGSFEYYCSVGSHRAMGMKGTLIVK